MLFMTWSATTITAAAMADNSNVASERVLEKVRLISRADSIADSTRVTPGC